MMRKLLRLFVEDIFGALIEIMLYLVTDFLCGV